MSEDYRLACLGMVNALGSDPARILERALVPDVHRLTYAVGYVPDREALVFLGKAITYRQLDQLADRMAALFVARGARAGSGGTP